MKKMSIILLISILINIGIAIYNKNGTALTGWCTAVLCLLFNPWKNE